MVPFQEVWSRSYCQAMEKLVDVAGEFPDVVEYIFSPSCVPLQRCTGCCGDESLSCLPVTKKNITMQVGNPCPSSILLFRPTKGTTEEPREEGPQSQTQGAPRQPLPETSLSLATFSALTLPHPSPRSFG